jgi:hypothetical protein
MEVGAANGLQVLGEVLARNPHLRSATQPWPCRYEYSVSDGPSPVKGQSHMPELGLQMDGHTSFCMHVSLHERRAPAWLNACTEFVTPWPAGTVELSELGRSSSEVVYTASSALSCCGYAPTLDQLALGTHTGP